MAKGAAKSVVVRKHRGDERYESVADAARAAGVSYMTFYMRLRNGKSPSEAMKTKVRRYERRTKVVNEAAIEFWGS